MNDALLPHFFKGIKTFRMGKTGLGLWSTLIVSLFVSAFVGVIFGPSAGFWLLGSSAPAWMLWAVGIVGVFWGVMTLTALHLLYRHITALGAKATRSEKKKHRDAKPDAYV